MKSSIGLLILAGLLCANRIYAQTRSDPDSFGFLSIQSEESDLIAVVDAKVLLALPADSARLRAGYHHVRVQHGIRWNAQVMDTTIAIAPDAWSVITIPKRYSYAILSEPSGALVSVKDKTLGVTPLNITSDRPLSLPLALSLSHFEEMTLEPPFPPVSRARLFADGAPNSDRMFEASHSIRNHSAWIYGSIASGILCGTLSALAKNQADSYNNRYLATANSSHRNKSKTYDMLAASTLLITELSFGVLSYLLLAQ